MTTATPTFPGQTSRPAAFVDLICQDDELLQAEFEALVAAVWSCPPPSAWVDLATLQPPQRALPFVGVSGQPGVEAPDRRLSDEGHSRQRSPPGEAALPDVPSRPRPRTRPGPTTTNEAVVGGQSSLHAELGVPPDATQSEIVRAFRRRLRELHPDTRPDRGTAAALASDHALQRLLAAYGALRPRDAPAIPHRVAPRRAAPVAQPPTAPSEASCDEWALRATPVRWEPAEPPSPRAAPGCRLSATELPPVDLFLR